MEATSLNAAGGLGQPVQSDRIRVTAPDKPAALLGHRRCWAGVRGWHSSGAGGGQQPASSRGSLATVCLERAGWCGRAALSGCGWTVLQSWEG